MNRENIKTDLFNFAAQLKENGFTVLVSAKHPFNWLHFEKDGQLGTVGPDNLGGYSFSTVHKPCRECGTGYGTEDHAYLTIEHATGSLIFAPGWAHSSDRAAIKKYKSVEDFINSIHNKWAEYYIL